MASHLALRSCACGTEVVGVGTPGKGWRRSCRSPDGSVPRQHTLPSVSKTQTLSTELQAPTLSVWTWLSQGPPTPTTCLVPSRKAPGTTGALPGGGSPWDQAPGSSCEPLSPRRAAPRGGSAAGNSGVESTRFPSSIWKQRGNYEAASASGIESTLITVCRGFCCLLFASLVEKSLAWGGEAAHRFQPPEAGGGWDGVSQPALPAHLPGHQLWTVALPGRGMHPSCPSLDCLLASG